MRRIRLVTGLTLALAVVGAGPARAAERRSPKKVVAVSDFKVTAQRVSGRSYWNQGQIGQGMRSMLVEALVKTGQFIVVERGEGLGDIRAEQSLKARGDSRGAGAERGELMAAQALFRGEITDFTPGQQGAKANVGGFKVGGINVSNVGVGLENASIASIVRWFDTSSGEVIDSFQSEAKATAVGFDLKAYERVRFGTEAFTQTPVGRATNDVIKDTVAKIVAAMARVPFQCKIVKATTDEVYLNVGGESGIGVGDRYDVFSIGEALVDPDSGRKLGAPKRRLGTIVVSAVEPKFSLARFEGAPGGTPKPGDVAQELARD